MTRRNYRSEDETQLAQLQSYRLVTEVEVTIFWKQRFNDSDKRVSKYFARNVKGITTNLILRRSCLHRKTKLLAKEAAILLAITANDYREYKATLLSNSVMYRCFLRLSSYVEEHTLCALF